jgi:hypothetical protein
MFHISRQGPLAEILLEWPHLVPVQIYTLHELHHAKTHENTCCNGTFTTHLFLVAKLSYKTPNFVKGEEEISTCEGCCKDVFLNKWSTRNRLQDIPNFLNLNKIEARNFNLKLDRLFIF